MENTTPKIDNVKKVGEIYIVDFGEMVFCRVSEKEWGYIQDVGGFRSYDPVKNECPVMEQMFRDYMDENGMGVE